MLIVGNNVVAVDHKLHELYPSWYPVPGTKGKVIKVDDEFYTMDLILVQWELGSTSEDDQWWVEMRDVEGIF